MRTKKIAKIHDTLAEFLGNYAGSVSQLDKNDRATERKRLMHRSSVLDALRESAGALNKTLNQTDRGKLDQSLTSVREVEQQLQMSQEWLDRPKPKSPIEEVLDEERKHINEMALFYELIALALETDSTRVATFEIPAAE